MSREEVPSLAEWLEDEPFTLTMSSGFCGFYAHAGALSALAERDLMPARTRGSSAGALVTALWASGLEPERIQEELSDVRREEFWDPHLGFGLLRGKLFDEKLRVIIGDRRIEESNVPVAISVTDVFSRQAEVIKSGDLVTAVRASCAFPGLFQPVKVDGRFKLDGGILDRPGLAETPPDERIFFHNLASRGIRSRFDRGHAQAINGRTNMQTLQIAGMPRVTPFKLEVGMEAFRHAKVQTELALSQPIETEAI